MKAFPLKAVNKFDDSEGMDLRDYFAAQALTGAQIWDAVLNGRNSVLAANGVDTLAEVAYAVADAMMKAREKL
jgi:hypothetical protein